MNKPHHVSKIPFNKSPHYQSLVTRAKQLQQLTQILKGYIPSPINQHIAVANFTEHTLVVITDSPVWATKLRYLCSELTQRLNQHREFVSLTTFDIKIGIPADIRGHSDTNLRLTPLSPIAASHIREAADSLRDPALKKALLRLAKNDI